MYFHLLRIVPESTMLFQKGILDKDIEAKRLILRKLHRQELSEFSFLLVKPTSNLRMSHPIRLIVKTELVEIKLLFS